MNNITKYSLIIAGFFIASFGLFWFLDSPSQQTVTQQSSPSTTKEACSRTLSEVSGDYYCDAEGNLQKTLTNQQIDDAQADAREVCSIKGNISYNTGEKIYHIPGQKYYEQTNIDTAYGEKMFCSEQEAINAGWRKSYE